MAQENKAESAVLFPLSDNHSLVYHWSIYCTLSLAEETLPERRVLTLNMTALHEKNSSVHKSPLKY